MSGNGLGYFSEDGDKYVITTPRTPATWFNYLFNDTYYMEASQTGQGKSVVFLPKHRTYSRGYKYFYVKDTQSGEFWCPAYQPLKLALDSYRCTHALGWTELQALQSGIESSIRVFVPPQGLNEIWAVTLTNRSSQVRELSLFSVFGLENGGVMGSKCTYDEERRMISSFSFPYHVYYEDKAKVEDHTHYVYFFSDRRPESYDCSERRFFGGDDVTEPPQAVLNGSCSNRIAESENPVGAFEHRISLQPGESASLHLVMGCANSQEEAASRKEELITYGLHRILEDIEKIWSDTSDRFTVETPDENVNFFMNHWLKKQIVLQTRTNRMTNYCPIRNQLQDALGYAMLDPDGAFDYMASVLKRQMRSGFIQQWIMTDGSAPTKLCLLTHKDGPIWLVLCFSILMNQAGDISLLDRMVEFQDSGECASIYEHLLLAIEFMANEVGAHGLCLMGDGDWNDPINGPGRLGLGESAWSTMAIIYAIRSFSPFCTMRGDLKAAARLAEIVQRFDAALNTHCWDGEWYVAGFDDNGEPFGTSRDQEGRLFLNAQTWAIMSGVARGDRLERVIKAIDNLDTAVGPRLLDPPFSGWNPKWGRISIKLEGTTENGSVYCHASMFKAFADCVVGRGTKAYETIARTLPTNPDNPPHVNLQVPIFLPNFYFGLPDSPNFGQSSHHNQTGTVGWMIWTMLESVLGVKATVEGLKLEPCMPEEWPSCRVSRTFRKARYDIRFFKSTSADNGAMFVKVNGEQWPGKVLPYEEGQVYQVEVAIGALQGHLS